MSYVNFDQIVLPQGHPNQSPHLVWPRQWRIGVLLALFCKISRPHGFFIIWQDIGDHLVRLLSSHLHQGLEGPVASHLTGFSFQGRAYQE